MPEIDRDLATALKQARTRPMHFAFLEKGAGKGTLIVHKMPIKSATINTAKKELGGGKLYKGRCTGSSNGLLVFETAKEPPPTLAKTLKAVIHRDAGLMLKVDARSAADLSDDEDEDGADATAAATATPKGAATELKEAQQPARAVPAPAAAATADGAPGQTAHESTASAPTPSASRQAEVTKRLAALIGPYKEAVSLNGPAAPQMRSLMEQAKKHITQRDFEQAARDLDELEPLVGQAKIVSGNGSAPASATPVVSGGSPGQAAQEPKASAPTPNASRQAEVTKRLAALVGPYKEAVSQNGPAAAHMQSRMAAAKQHITQRDFDQAAKDLDELEPLVEQSKNLNVSGVRAEGSTPEATAPADSDLITTGSPDAPATPPRGDLADNVDVEEPLNEAFQRSTMSAAPGGGKMKGPPQSPKEADLRNHARKLAQELDQTRSVLGDHNEQLGRPRNAAPPPDDLVGRRLAEQVKDLERRLNEVNGAIVKEKRRNQPKGERNDHMDRGKSPTDSKEGTHGTKKPEGGGGPGEGKAPADVKKQPEQKAPAKGGGSPEPPAKGGGSPTGPTKGGGSPEPPAKGGGSPKPPAKGGGSPTPPAKAAPKHVPLNGSLTKERVTVNYDFRKGQSSGSVTLRKINAPDYPADNDEKIGKFFKDRPLLEGMGTMAVGVAAQEASDKMLDLVQSHFNTALEKANEAFEKAYPPANELTAQLDEAKKAYDYVVDYLQTVDPNWIKDMKGVAEKDKAAVEALRGNLEVAFDYENALIDMQARVAQLNPELPPLADDIDARATALLDIARNLEESFAWIQEHLAAILIVYYQSFTLWSVKDVFKSLGHSVSGFAGAIRTRETAYENYIKKLDETRAKVSAELEPWRDWYQAQK